MATRITVPENGRHQRVEPVTPSAVPQSNHFDTPSGVVLAEFPAFLSGYSGDKWDNLVLSIVVPRVAKYDGMKVTDHRGELFHVQITSLDVDLDQEQEEASDG